SAALMELVTEAPWFTDLLPPLLREKSKEVDAGFTVKLKVVVLVTPPPVPVTVTVEVPVVADAPAVRVRVVEHVGVHAVGENAAVTPEGSPDAQYVPARRSSDLSAALMELVTEAPWVTVLLPPLLREKSKVLVPRSFLMVK